MNRIQNLIALVKPYYDTTDPSHDWAHIGRVAATAGKIAELEKANLEIVLAGVYCHDLVNLAKDHPDRKNASTIAAKEAQPHLIKAGFNPIEIEQIQKVIVEHSFSKGLKPSSLEGSIVQDADRLDAIGAIGILRCAAVNNQMQGSFYDPFDPMAEMRELDDRKYMLDHYFTKLFKLPEMMNTSAAKEIAKQRVLYMQDFIKQFMTEVRS